MDTYQSIMVDKNGNRVEARTIACPDCGGIHFIIYYVGNQTTHSHLMCAQCNESFCEQGDDCAFPDASTKEH